MGASLDEDARDEDRLKATTDAVWPDASDGALDEDGEDARDEARLEASDGNLEAVRLDALAELEARLEALDGALVDGSLDGTKSSGPTHSPRGAALFLVLLEHLDLEDEREQERFTCGTCSSLSVLCGFINGGSVGAIVR